MRPLKGFEIADVIRNGIIENYDNYEYLMKYCYQRLNVYFIINNVNLGWPQGLLTLTCHKPIWMRK